MEKNINMNMCTHIPNGGNILDQINMIKSSIENSLNNISTRESENPGQGESVNQNMEFLIKSLLELPVTKMDINSSKITTTIKKLKEVFAKEQGINTLIQSLIAKWKKIIKRPPEKSNHDYSEKVKKKEKEIEKEKETYNTHSPDFYSVTLDLNENSVDCLNDKNISMISDKIQASEKDPTRKNIKKLIFEYLARSDATSDYLGNMNTGDNKIEFIVKTALEIEKGLYDKYILSNKVDKYKMQTKTIVANLSKNKEFVSNILTGNLNPKKIAEMSAQEMISSEEKSKIEKTQELLFDARRSDWNKIHNNLCTTGMYRCGKCKGNNTFYCQAQIRRADEPMTTFVTCSDCNNQWKC